MSTSFFKSPPHITVAEMCGHLPSFDAVFEASSSNEYSRLVAASPARTETQVRSLKDLIALYLREEWEGPESLDLASIDLGHLISLLFGRLHPLTN
jgi:hypothetical protein